LDSNQLCGLDGDGKGEYTTEGITKLCEGLKGSSVTSLRCALGRAFAFLSLPVDTLTAFASPIGSVDGHTLQIDELKGTKPTEKIDLSGKGLSVASAIIIIASCIKGNGVLKELKCARRPGVRFLCQCPLTPLFSCFAVSGITTSETRVPLRSLPSSKSQRSPAWGAPWPRTAAPDCNRKCVNAH
jgi:hypothetical protein